MRAYVGAWACNCVHACACVYVHACVGAHVCVCVCAHVRARPTCWRTCDMRTGLQGYREDTCDMRTDARSTVLLGNNQSAQKAKVFHACVANRGLCVGALALNCASAVELHCAHLEGQ